MHEFAFIAQSIKKLGCSTSRFYSSHLYACKLVGEFFSRRAKHITKHICIASDCFNTFAINFGYVKRCSRHRINFFGRMPCLNRSSS